MHSLYMASLCATIVCLTLVDWRFRLAFWHRPKRTAVTLALSIAVFCAWDIFGIRWGIFFHGDSDYTLPWRLATEFPVEELFFLYVLCYTTLLLYTWTQRRWAPTAY